MIFYFANIAGGALIGAVLAWILMLWVKVFVKEVYATAPENSAKISFDSNSKNIPDWGIHLYEMSLTDMTLRMHLLRIPFEPLGFLNRHLKILEEQKDSDGIEKSISSFHDNAVQELKKLQLFSESFAGVDEIFQNMLVLTHRFHYSYFSVHAYFDAVAPRKRFENTSHALPPPPIACRRSSARRRAHPV